MSTSSREIRREKKGSFHKFTASLKIFSKENNIPNVFLQYSSPKIRRILLKYIITRPWESLKMNQILWNADIFLHGNKSKWRIRRFCWNSMRNTASYLNVVVLLKRLQESCLIFSPNPQGYHTHRIPLKSWKLFFFEN